MGNICHNGRVLQCNNLIIILGIEYVISLAFSIVYATVIMAVYL